MPFARTTLFSDDRLELVIVTGGFPLPEFDMRIKDSSEVFFPSSEVVIESPSWLVSKHVVIGTNSPAWRDNHGFQPASRFYGPLNTSLQSEGFLWDSPDEIVLTFPRVEIGGTEVRFQPIKLVKSRAWALVGPCQ